MKKTMATSLGFSLIEMLLVLAVISAILMAVLGYTVQKSDEMRRDRTVMQIQQIENAGLAHYVSTSTWPATLATLTGNGFLPNVPIKSAWATDYFVSSDTAKGTFLTCTTVVGSETTAPAIAQVIAGRVPMGYVTDGETAAAPCPSSNPPSPCTHDHCTVVSMVNIPGQNLNNARSFNFSGIYRNGGCVPAPYCPPGMTADIVAFPVSVLGVYDASNATKLYPLTGFTAYATGQTALGSAPYICNQQGAGGSQAVRAACSAGSSGTLPSAPFFWRVCMKIVTDQGPLSDAGNVTGQNDAAYIAAITRCKPGNESQGSGFEVFIPFFQNHD